MDLYFSRYEVGHSENSNTKTTLPHQFHKMIKLEDLYTRFDGSTGYQAAQSLDQSYYTGLQGDDLENGDRNQVVLKWYKYR